MGRLKIVTAEGSYTEMDRQLKEQFMHGLNNDDMMMEIIKELTKTEETVNMTTEQILAWARRVEAQSAIVSKLSEIKDFDKISTGRRVQGQTEV